jgi:hypothetical protein
VAKTRSRATSPLLTVCATCTRPGVLPGPARTWAAGDISDHFVAAEGDNTDFAPRARVADASRAACCLEIRPTEQGVSGREACTQGLCPRRTLMALAWEGIRGFAIMRCFLQADVARRGKGHAESADMQQLGLVASERVERLRTQSRKRQTGIRTRSVAVPVCGRIHLVSRHESAILV